MPRATRRTGEGKRKLLERRGLGKVPRGKEVHHKVPLSEGGSDTIRNVMLKRKKAHRALHGKR